MLEKMGLSGAQERVYLFLLSAPGSDINEIATATKLAVDRTRDILAELEHHSLIASEGEDEARYLPNAPGTAIASLARQRQHDIEKARTHAAPFLNKIYRDSSVNPDELIEIVVGADTLKERASRAIAAAGREVMVLSRPPYMQSSQDWVELNFQPGVRRRYIYDQQALAVADHLGQIEMDVREGELARVLPCLPVKLVIADRAAAFLPLDAQDLEVNAGLIVQPSSLLQALITLFESLWELALPLRFATTPSDQLDESDADDVLLSMLATGLTDAVIARRLHTSPRSLRRRIARLQEELGARSRFQAGVQAVRRNRIR